jgi:hypothetical protein
MTTDISCATRVKTLTFLNIRMKGLARPQNVWMKWSFLRLGFIYWYMAELKLRFKIFYCESIQCCRYKGRLPMAETVTLSLQWLRQIVITLETWRYRFNPRPVHMGFLVDRVVLGQVFLQILQSSHVRIIPPMFHFHSFLYHLCYIILEIDSVKLQCVVMWLQPHHHTL